jgi:hypothetical protein
VARRRSSRADPGQAQANLGRPASQVVKANRDSRASRSSSASRAPVASPS